MKIRKFEPNDLIKAAELISITYATFNNKEGSQEAVKSYIDGFDPKVTSFEKLQEKFSRTPIMFVAEENGELLGVIRGTIMRVVNLYVSGSAHGKGIGKKLLEAFEREVIQLGSSVIKIRSSLYALSFYQKQGYKKTTGLRKTHGHVYQPMQKKL